MLINEQLQPGEIVYPKYLKIRKKTFRGEGENIAQGFSGLTRRRYLGE